MNKKMLMVMMMFLGLIHFFKFHTIIYDDESMKMSAIVDESVMTIFKIHLRQSLGKSH